VQIRAQEREIEMLRRAAVRTTRGRIVPNPHAGG